MATNLITNIYADFRSTYDGNPQPTLDFFAKNTIIFNSIKSFDNPDDLHHYMEMISFYADALYQKGRLNDTIDVINKSIAIIDSEIERHNAAEIKDDWYRSILFYKGMASYGLRDYKTAVLIFKELVEYDSRNEKYESWLRSSMLGRRSRTVLAIYIVCGLFIIIEITLQAFGLISYRLTQIPIIIGLSTAICTTIYEYYVKRNTRKSKAS